MKTQTVRLIDVFVIAPFLVYAGMKYKMPEGAAVAMIGIGVATAVYNWNNYVEERG